jgi:hypothetical protein
VALYDVKIGVVTPPATTGVCKALDAPDDVFPPPHPTPPWSALQELGHIRGGVLADEMGMGKTIQVS